MEQLSDKLVPFNKEKKHSISEAIFTIFLPNRLFELNKFKVLIESDGKLSGNFQHFKILEGVQVNVNLDENSTLQQVKTGEDGFQIEGFSNGKLEWIIRYQPNNLGLHQLTIHSLSYNRWDEFYSSVFKFLTAIDSVDSSIYVSGYAISYIDQFDWIDNKYPQVDLIFKNTSKYLSKSIFESKENWNIISNFDSILSYKLVKEHINIGCRKLSEKLYNLYLFHVSNLLLPEPHSLNNLSINHETMKSIADELHLLNISFLKDSLNENILKLIGVNKI